MTSRIIYSRDKELYPQKDFRDKTVYMIDTDSGNTLAIQRNCNHPGDCTEDCAYIYLIVKNKYRNTSTYVSLSTENIQEFVAAFLAIRKEAGLE